jgi:hypothetical protein
MAQYLVFTFFLRSFLHRLTQERDHAAGHQQQADLFIAAISLTSSPSFLGR